MTSARPCACGAVEVSGAPFLRPWLLRQSSTAAGAILEKDAVERIAREIAGGLGLDRRGIQLEVLATEADFPQVIRQQTQKEGAKGDI